MLSLIDCVLDLTQVRLWEKLCEKLLDKVRDLDLGLVSTILDSEALLVRELLLEFCVVCFLSLTRRRAAMNLFFASVSVISRSLFWRREIRSVDCPVTLEAISSLIIVSSYTFNIDRPRKT